MAPPNDKRRHPRVANRITVESPDRKLLLETVDLSAGGLSCRAPVFLAPMTKMAVSLVLPGNGGAEKADQVVRGEAVVVRTEPEKDAAPADGLYRIALFFSRMDESDRRKLQEYLRNLAGRNGRA
jgi:c-di-GMP-binding flagellar brake protein YcgR